MPELKSRWMVAKPLTEGCWVVENKKHRHYLGDITFYPQWKEWIFSPDENAIFSTECLADLARFLKELNEAKT